MKNRPFATSSMRWFLTSLILAFGITSGATSLTSQQALQRAIYSNQALSSPLRVKITSSQPQYRLVYTDNQAQPTYYIYTPASQRGFLVVAGDDAVSPILGYSDQGTFNLDHMPENMKAWLEQYSLQIEQARINKAPAYIETSDGIVGQTSISPLLSTVWSQGAPYNDNCPIIDGNSCLAGSVATAMAQIMNYHKYPEHGQGDLSYEWNNTMLSANLSSYYFDWDNMLDNYNDYSANEADAVASLMSACGLATRTQYSLTDSRANVFEATPSYSQFFDYDENVFFAYRAYHVSSDWNQLIYNQLQYVGPIQMKGDTQGNSYSFVCDGYDQDGYFHINWGCGGNYDGYFLLNNLYQEDTAETYSNIGFIGGISKPNSQYLHKEVVVNSIDVTEIYSAERILYLTFNNWQNNCALTLTMNLGLKLQNELTNQVAYVPFFKMSMPFGDNFTGSIMVNIPASLPYGAYIATPAFSEDDEWFDIYVNTDSAQSFSIINDESGISLMSADSHNISCQNLTVESDLVWGRKCNLNFDIVNSGDEKFAGLIQAAIFNGDTMCGSTNLWQITVPAQSSREFEVAPKFDVADEDNTPQPGVYTLYILDDTGNKISNGVEVTLLDPNLLPNLNVVAVAANGPIYWNYPFDGKISLQNTNDVAGEVKFSVAMYEKVPNEEFEGIYSRGNLVAYSPQYSLWLEPLENIILTSENLEFIINQSVTGEIPQSGEYLLGAFDQDGDPYSFLSWVDFLNEEPPIVVSSISLDVDSLDLYVGDMFTLTATIMPEEARDFEITWTSTNPDVATVVNGEITAVSEGVAEIIASCDNCSASCMVNVSKPIIYAESITLSQNEAVMEIGETLQLSATVLPENTTNKTVTWTSDNETVAIVDDFGQITAISGGNATITAYCENASSVCNIIVNEKEPEEVPVENITLNLVEATLEVGGEVYLKATITPENATNQTVSWGTSNSAIATVKDGWVTAIAPGKATITAICDGMSASCIISVNYPYIEPTSITIEPENATLDIGESISLIATVMPEGATYGELTWTTSNNKVAVVTQGIVTALGYGSATINVLCDGLVASCEITVNPPYVEVESISLNKTYIVLEVGTTFQLEATVGPEDATDKSVVWSSDNTSIVTVDDMGLVTPVAEGTANIYAQAGNVMAVCKVKVKPAPIQYTLMLDASLVCLDIDDVYQLTATLSPADDTAVISWYSNNPMVALIDQTGKVYAVGRGNAIITAKCNNTSASCEFIIGKEVQEIIWNQTFDDVYVGDIIPLTATATSGLDVEYGFISGSDIASINGNVLNLGGEGTVEIYAYQNGDDTYRPAEHVNKTIKVTAGLNEVNADNIKLSADGLVLIIDGLKSNEIIKVFSIDGKVIYCGSDKRIALPCHGSYLVKISDYVTKIML